MRRTAKILVLLCVLVCAGCATMPITGPVMSEPRQVLEEGPGGVTFVAEPPPQGAPPSMIIRGFLTAMAGFGQDYATAREYLTTEASDTWNPADSEVLIYASGTTPRVEEGTMQVTMSGALIGYLHPDGSFVGSEDLIWEHDFGMVRENGEWRISDPPAGLALSQYMFSQSYMRIDTYFFPTSGSTLVPDPRYVPRGAWDRTTAAGLVLDGPSDWLEFIADPGIREDVFLDGDVTLSNLGVAEVPLSCGSQGLPTSDATVLAIEIAATMRDMTGVSRVRLLCDGSPLPLSGASQDASLPVSIVDNYSSPRAMTPATIVTVHDGIVASMSDSVFTPVPGEWGTIQHSIHSFAISADLNQIAAVTDDGLMIGPLGDGPSVQILAGSDFLRPQYDSRGNLWAVGSVNGHLGIYTVAKQDLVRAIMDQKPPTVVTVNTTALDDMDVQGFQVSPDGHRILFIRHVDSNDGGRMEVGISLITYEKDVASAIIAWKPIRLIWEEAQFKSIVDLAWMGPSSFVLLAGSGTASPRVFVTNIDGLEMDEWGLPQSLDSANSDQNRGVEMATHTTSTSTQIVVREQDGTVWSYQDAYQWRLLGDEVTSIGFPT